jgi:hypothetical protein
MHLICSATAPFQRFIEFPIHADNDHDEGPLNTALYWPPEPLRKSRNAT